MNIQQIYSVITAKSEARDSYIVRLTEKPDQPHIGAVDRQEGVVLQR